VPDAPLPAADSGVTVLSAAVSLVRTGDNFGWRIEVAIAWPPPDTQGRSNGPDDEWAEKSVRNVRSSTNVDRFGKNGLEKDWNRKQALYGPMRAASSPTSSLIAELEALQ
jgi:hypothetical protein